MTPQKISKQISVIQKFTREERVAENREENNRGSESI